MDVAKSLFLSSLCLLLVAVPAFALGQGGIELDMLSVGVGARPLGMGSAFTAVADNADSPFWNPAGLASVNFNEITSTQTRLSTDTDHYYVSYVRPMGRGAIGISWIQIGTGGITQTSKTVDAYNEVQNIGGFSYFSSAYLLSYGVSVTKKIAAGVTAKYLASDLGRIAGGQASGYSVTPGIMIKPTDLFSIGFRIDELLNELDWGTGTKEKAPPKLIFGMALRPSSPKFSGLFALDFSQILKQNGSGSISTGYEWKRESISLRLGCADSSLTAGAGFKSGVAQIDYAYIRQESLSPNNVHRISLTGRW